MPVRCVPGGHGSGDVSAGTFRSASSTAATGSGTTPVRSFMTDGVAKPSATIQRDAATQRVSLTTPTIRVRWCRTGQAGVSCRFSVQDSGWPKRVLRHHPGQGSVEVTGTTRMAVAELRCPNIAIAAEVEHAGLKDSSKLRRSNGRLRGRDVRPTRSVPSGFVSSTLIARSEEMVFFSPPAASAPGSSPPA